MQWSAQSGIGLWNNGKPHEVAITDPDCRRTSIYFITKNEQALMIPGRGSTRDHPEARIPGQLGQGEFHCPSLFRGLLEWFPDLE
eukprot:678171-Hanusia_phi.AAC.1